jgi:hypothetical protein
MKRTLPWAIVALYPLIALAALNLLGGSFEGQFPAQLAASTLGALVVEYWWPFLIVTYICAVAFFLVSVLRNRAVPVWSRILWALGMVFLAVIVVPAYWWRHSERGAH